MINISSIENTPETQLSKELLKLEQDRLDSEIQHLCELLTLDMQSAYENIQLTPRNREKQSDFKQLPLTSPKLPISSRSRPSSSPRFSSTDEFSPEAPTERYHKVTSKHKTDQHRRSVNPTFRSHNACPSWSSHKDTSFELNLSSESIPDESEMNYMNFDYRDEMSPSRSMCNIPRTSPKKRSICRDKIYNEQIQRGRAGYVMPAFYNPPVCYQYPAYMYNPYPYYIAPPMYSYQYPPQPAHSHHISEPLYYPQQLTRSKSVSKEVSTQASNSFLSDLKHKSPSHIEIKIQHKESELDIPTSNTVEIPSVPARDKSKEYNDQLITESTKQSEPNDSYKIMVKEPWAMNFTETEKKVSDLFQQKKKNMLNKLQEQKSKSKKDYQEKSAEELLNIRKSMLKSTSHKDLPPRAVSAESPVPIKKFREPSPELLARLCAGEKSKLTPQEIKRINQKNYSALPEVQNKKTVEDKKQELKLRQAKAKEFNNKLRGNIIRNKLC